MNKTCIAFISYKFDCFCQQMACSIWRKVGWSQKNQFKNHPSVKCTCQTFVRPIILLLWNNEFLCFSWHSLRYEHLIEKIVKIYSMTRVWMTLQLKLMRARKAWNRAHLVEVQIRDSPSQLQIIIETRQVLHPLFIKQGRDELVLERHCCVLARIFKMLVY